MKEDKTDNEVEIVGVVKIKESTTTDGQGVKSGTLTSKK